MPHPSAISAVATTARRNSRRIAFLLARARRSPSTGFHWFTPERGGTRCSRDIFQTFGVGDARVIPPDVLGPIFQTLARLSKSVAETLIRTGDDDLGIRPDGDHKHCHGQGTGSIVALANDKVAGERLVIDAHAGSSLTRRFTRRRPESRRKLRRYERASV